MIVIKKYVKCNSENKGFSAYFQLIRIMLRGINPNIIQPTNFKFILSFSKIESNGKIKNLPVSIPEKNYTSFKIENEIPTHEGAVAPARASLRSENEHRFNGKFFSLRSCFFEAPEFSQIGFADFVKPNVK
jgi:hypothetical protein